MIRKLTVLATILLMTVLSGQAPAWSQETPPTKEEPTSMPPEEAPGVYADIAKVEVDGKEVTEISPGVQARLYVRFVNSGSATLNGVTFTILERPEGVRVNVGPYTIGNLAAGAEKILEIPVTVDLAGCQDFLGLFGEAKSGESTYGVKFGVPVACPGPRLSIEQWTFVGGDGDHVPEPGEKLSLTLTLRNSGRDAAPGFSGTLTIRSDDWTVVTGTSKWPDIAPGQAATNLTPFLVEVKSSAKTQDGCAPYDGGPGSGDVIEPDGVVTSDGSVSSDGTVAPDGSGSSSGGSGGGSSGSTGGSSGSEPNTGTDQPAKASDLPASTEPGTTTIQPMPAESSKPDPTSDPGTRSGGGPIEPAPAPEDPGVAFEAALRLTTDPQVTLDFANQTICAFTERGGPASNGTDDAAKGRQVALSGAESTGATNPAGNSAAAIAVAAIVSMIAIGIRAQLLGRPASHLLDRQH